MKNTIVLGSLNADFLFKVHQFPHLGQTAHSCDFMPMLGGKGGNQAAAIARLGGKAVMVGKVGNDVFGPQSIDNLKKQGVDVSHIYIDKDQPTGTAMGIVADNGDNVIVVNKGANGNVRQADVDCIDPLFPQSGYLVMQMEIPLEMILYALEKAGKSHVEVVLNPAPAYPIPSEYYQKIDYLIPNEYEAGVITGQEVSDLASALSAGEKLIAQGSRTVIITLGANGALLMQPGQRKHFPAVEVDVVDPTACGDGFVGGFVVSLERGYNLDDAVLFANCAGALTATRFGAQPSLPYQKEVDELFAKVKNTYAVEDL